MLLVVNYHYFGNEQFTYPGIHPLSPKTFKLQLEELGRYFEFVSEEDLLAAVDGVRSLPEKACLVTFDDGLQEQYTQAAPVMDDLKVPGIFFIPGKPLAESQPLTVHRIHWLRSQTAPSVFQELLFSTCGALGFSDRLAAAGKGIEEKYFWDDVDTKKAKYLLNVLLTEGQKETLLKLMDRQLKLDGRAYFEELYMKPGQVQELGRRFAVGTHGYSHAALARWDRSGIEKDMKQGIEVLSRVFGAPASVSYPHGYKGAISGTVFEAAQNCGLRIGFTTERSFNLTLEAPLALARVDTNDAPGGKQPIIFPTDDGFDLKGPMKLCRTQFWRESGEPSGTQTVSPEY